MKKGSCRAEGVVRGRVSRASALSPSFCLPRRRAGRSPRAAPTGRSGRPTSCPKTAAHVYYVAPDGKADAPGTTLAQPTTLEAAIARVVTGDAIVLRGGTYRTGGLRLNQGITIQPYADEQPVLKGTQVATQVGGPARRPVAHLLDAAVPGQAAGLVAARPRGHEDAAPSLQQRHGLRRRRAAAGRPAGKARSTRIRSTSTTRPARSTSASIPTNRLVEITAFDSALDPDDRRTATARPRTARGR